MKIQETIDVLSALVKRGEIDANDDLFVHDSVTNDDYLVSSIVSPTLIIKGGMLPHSVKLLAIRNDK